jgi:hypothetical protein
MQLGLGLSLTGRQAQFNPSSLFPDLWLDPYDLSTLYQDSAGTTAGVVGQPVGLALDKSRGARGSIGADLVSNGAFDSDTVWSKGAGWTIGGGKATKAAGTGSALAESIAVTANSFYEVSYTVIDFSAGAVNVSVGGGTSSANATANGTYTYILFCGAGSATVSVFASAAFVGSVDNVSVREIPGNHVLQATSAARPTADSTPYPGISADGFDDSLTCATGGGGTAGILLSLPLTVNGGAGTARTIWSDAGTNTGYRLRINASNQLELSAGNGVAFTTIATVATLPVGETHVVTAWDDGSTLNVQIDNGTVASVARPAVSAGTAGFTLLKDNGAATSFLSSDFHQAVYVKNSAKTSAERAMLKRFNGGKAGLAL